MGEPILELHGITCEVSPGQCLFEDVSFAVNEGEYGVRTPFHKALTMIRSITRRHSRSSREKWIWEDDAPQMYGFSCSPQGKDTVSWEVREEPYFYRLAESTGDTNIDYKTLFSRTPQAHGRDKSTRESEGDGLSPFPTISIPTFRTRVLYVPQRPSLLPGTPRDFLYSVSQLKSHQASYTVIDEDSENDELSDVFERAIEVAGKWGVHAILWEREWSNLSGGEAQRIVLATALSLDTAEVLLLDGE